jgi:predicted nucleotidyltransferase
VDPEIDAFLQCLVEWAKTQPDLLAIALAGSYARGTAGPDSDVDLILLMVDPEAYLADRDWICRFGEPTKVVKEDWGKVTSLRVFYARGLEVEFGISGCRWGSDPTDEGDARVIRDGCIVLYERARHLSSNILRFSDPV